MEITKQQRLVFAARAGNSEKVKILIEAGVSPDSPEENLGAPLFAALTGRHFNVVKILLEMGASVLFTDQFGDGPLEYALHFADDESIFELLAYNAKLRTHTKRTYHVLLEQTLVRRKTG